MSDKADYTKSAFETAMIHAGQHKDPDNGALVTPIFQTTTFAFDNVDVPAAINSGKKLGYTYTRVKNPTTIQLEDKLSLVEGGEASVATSSGVGAISSTLLTLLNPGDHIIGSSVVYGITQLIFHHLERFGIEVTQVDTADTQAVKKAVKNNTKLIYVETPANPTLKISDISGISEIAHEAGALVVVDSTFAPPPMQFCLKLGADIVIHSTTKYMCGHGDAIGGIVVGKKDLIEAIRTDGVKTICGDCPSPFNSWLTLRGLKTEALRIKKHSENAMRLAQYLEGQSKYIKKVNYPGLKSHPQHELAVRQMNGLYGGVISFEMNDVNGKSGYEVCQELLNNLNICSLAVSLGDVDTLIEHPASMTHRFYTKEEMAAANITDRLIRLSVGLEDVDDLIEDFEQAFAQL